MLYVLVSVFRRRVVACKPAGRHIYDDGTTPLFFESTRLYSRKGKTSHF